MDKIPLNYEASEGDTHKKVTHTLPQEAVQCLESARFLHLSTCLDNIPNVSLMNYTYLPSSPYSAAPVIIMTTNTASRKTTNILANPKVSLLVHDWVTHRPSTQGRRPSGGSPGPEHRSSLASILLNMNASTVANISATIGGSARIAPTGSDEEKYFIEQHLEGNTYEDTNHIAHFGASAGNDERSGYFVAGEAVRVIIVDIQDIRISDRAGAVRDWEIVPESNVVNGIR
ncbi:FMN-binding split barrel-related protein [Paramyrothecium foliicola]|nr:FMN-binding split barrel-related protein [Paramyrothecium foliicola]